MMHIEIAARQLSGCTDFLPRPARLHLGSQNAEGVDVLAFALPPDWAGKSVSLHVERADGAPQTALLLDGQGQVAVDRRLTAARAGRWMLTATDGAGYTAYSQPGCFDTGEILAEGEAGEPPSPSLYEQFVAQVLDSAGDAASSAQAAAQSAGSASAAAGQAADAVSAAQAKADAASASAGRAEAAALRAEAVAPEEGPVISVNSQGGRVVLDAWDVGALPLPSAPAAGYLLRVRTVDSDTGELTTEAVPESSLSSFVRRTDRPTAQQAGPVKLAGGYGLALTADGALRLVPATQAQLDAMTEAWSPLTPALVPLAVKRALAAAWDSAAWTDGDRTQARATLGAAAASALEALTARVEALELGGGAEITQHPFEADLGTLANLTAAGVWNQAEARLEF